jgi:hypothetical protein
VVQKKVRAEGRGGETGEKFGPHSVLSYKYLRLVPINVPLVSCEDIDNMDYSVFRYSGFADCEERIDFKKLKVVSGKS